MSGEPFAGWGRQFALAEGRARAADPLLADDLIRLYVQLEALQGGAALTEAWEPDAVHAITGPVKELFYPPGAAIDELSEQDPDVNSVVTFLQVVEAAFNNVSQLRRVVEYALELGGAGLVSPPAQAQTTSAIAELLGPLDR